jgi:hypothetical protein
MYIVKNCGIWGTPDGICDVRSSDLVDTNGLEESDATI